MFGIYVVKSVWFFKIQTINLLERLLKMMLLLVWKIRDFLVKK
ncbi:Uncharacterised protein [Mycobacterium tuberculosis]|nr:Uncharacterised protein [Mycobacterium tuberculosis]